MNSKEMDIRYLQGYEVVCEDNTYQKEACDVRIQCISILSLSSSQNFASKCPRPKPPVRIIQMEPDKRFQPVCHRCGSQASGVHSWAQRKFGT